MKGKEAEQPRRKGEKERGRSDGGKEGGEVTAGTENRGKESLGILMN